MEASKECLCHLIDWTGENGNYIHIESDEIYDHQKHGALDCQKKVKEGLLNYGEYFNVCKYIPGDPNSHFPRAHEKVKEYKLKIRKRGTIEEGIPPISGKLFDLNNKFDS